MEEIKGKSRAMRVNMVVMVAYALSSLKGANDLKYF
jgi:hypothetical protein